MYICICVPLSIYSKRCSNLHVLWWNSYFFCAMQMLQFVNLQHAHFNLCFHLWNSNEFANLLSWQCKDAMPFSNTPQIIPIFHMLLLDQSKMLPGLPRFPMLLIIHTSMDLLHIVYQFPVAHISISLHLPPSLVIHPTVPPLFKVLSWSNCLVKLPNLVKSH
jgi:hypothetical protein